MSVCRSCHAPVRWVTMESGKANPLDPEPSDHGTIEVYQENPPMGRVVKQDDRLFPVPLFLSHFATCPDAAQHRRKR